MYLNKPVAYLTNEDFDSNGNLINPAIPTDKPVIIMIQAGFCSHCNTAKPAFQQFADKNADKIFAATIQADGEVPGEAELGKRINSIDSSFRGFPTYIAYYKGKRTIHNGGRGVSDLEKFANSL
jgi:thiol-disulfide isomerase/thioredoxin